MAHGVYLLTFLQDPKKADGLHAEILGVLSTVPAIDGKKKPKPISGAKETSANTGVSVQKSKASSDKASLSSSSESSDSDSGESSESGSDSSIAESPVTKPKKSKGGKGKAGNEEAVTKNKKHIKAKPKGDEESSSSSSESSSSSSSSSSQSPASSLPKAKGSASSSDESSESDDSGSESNARPGLGSTAGNKKSKDVKPIVSKKPGKNSKVKSPSESSQSSSDVEKVTLSRPGLGSSRQNGAATSGKGNGKKKSAGVTPAKSKGEKKVVKGTQPSSSSSGSSDSSSSEESSDDSSSDSDSSSSDEGTSAAKGKESKPVESSSDESSSSSDEKKRESKADKKAARRRSGVIQNLDFKLQNVAPKRFETAGKCDANKAVDMKNDDNGKSTSSKSAPVTPVSGEINGAPKSNKRRRSEGSGARPTPFKRVRVEDVVYADERLRDNTFHSKRDTYGVRAHKDLVVTRGKGFRKEKTKKKRLNHHGGTLSLEVNSYKFPDDSD